jgi:hypothetical protein
MTFFLALSLGELEHVLEAPGDLAPFFSISLSGVLVPLLLFGRTPLLLVGYTNKNTFNAKIHQTKQLIQLYIHQSDSLLIIY